MISTNTNVGQKTSGSNKLATIRRIFKQTTMKAIQPSLMSEFKVTDVLKKIKKLKIF